MRSRRRLSGESVAVAAFLPLHKVAFGVAAAAVAAILVFLATAVYLVRAPDPGFDLGLLAQYFAGYSVSWPGALIGAAWAAFAGYVLGWFFAFSRNLLIATMLFVVRRRAELREASRVLDQH